MATTDPTPCTPGETLELEYVGGGYYREKGYPKGEPAPTLHGEQVLTYSNSALAALRAENERLKDRDRALEAWRDALLPHLERLLDDDPNVFGTDGDGQDSYWPILAEFVTKGRALKGADT